LLLLTQRDLDAMSYAGLTRVSIDLPERLFSKDDGLPEAQTSLGGLRKADSYARQ
jgi:hypothetical protein